MSEKILTVVLKYDDDATLPGQLTEAFANGTKIGGCFVSAAFREDEISRVEKLEELVKDDF